MDIIKKMLKMNLSKYDFIIIKSAGSDYYKIGCSKLHGTKKEADETRDYIVKALKFYKEYVRSETGSG